MARLATTSAGGVMTPTSRQPLRAPGTSREELRNLRNGLTFVSPWLIGFCLFTFVPVALSLYYSFCDYSLLQKPVFRGLENYRQIAGDPVFWKVLKNTFIYAAMAL